MCGVVNDFIDDYGDYLFLGIAGAIITYQSGVIEKFVPTPAWIWEQFERDPPEPTNRAEAALSAWVRDDKAAMSGWRKVDEVQAG